MFFWWKVHNKRSDTRSSEVPAEVARYNRSSLKPECIIIVKKCIEVLKGPPKVLQYNRKFTITAVNCAKSNHNYQPCFLSGNNNNSLFKQQIWVNIFFIILAWIGANPSVFCLDFYFIYSSFPTTMLLLECIDVEYNIFFKNIPTTLDIFNDNSTIIKILYLGPW